MTRKTVETLIKVKDFKADMEARYGCKIDIEITKVWTALNSETGEVVAELNPRRGTITLHK